MPYATRRSYSGASAACTLTSSITSGDTTATLTGTTTAWPSTASGSFFMVIDPGLSTEEKVLVGARSTNALSTITRGVDGTTAVSHSAGATCYPVFTAVDADQANAVAAALTTKGDILATDGSALNRLAVGTNDYALLADSAATNGVAWKQIPAAGLASDAVTTAKILDSNVTAGKLATDSVTTAKIVDSNVTTAKIADANITGAKLANLTVSTKTGSYTLTAADRNTRVVMNSGSSTSITVNNSLFSAGDVVYIHNIGAGTCTVTAGTATVTTSSSLALAQWGGGTLYFTSASASIFFPYSSGVGFGVATGGSSSSITVGGIAYTLLVFTGSTTLTVSKEGNFDATIIGGGNAGTQNGPYAGNGGGGGGGGALVLSTSIYLPVGTYSVGIGGGGSISYIHGYASGRPLGGGQGGGGNSGGSAAIVGGFSGGSGVGVGPNGNANGGGGGGGMGAAGSNCYLDRGYGTMTNGGNGGAGVDWSVWRGQTAGTTYYGAGGGGSGGYGSTSGGSGGTGGGGTGGGYYSNVATPGTANTGSGGGGGTEGATAQAGGSGIVLVRFKV
jgi:hypothetical protein